MGSKKDKFSRKTIRKTRRYDTKKDVLFLYGRLASVYTARGYCTYHQCYLYGGDITEKKCNIKKCKNFEEVIKGQRQKNI